MPFPARIVRPHEVGGLALTSCLYLGRFLVVGTIKSAAVFPDLFLFAGELKKLTPSPRTTH